MDWSKRLKSFGMSAGAIIVTAIAAAIVSPDFLALLSQFGVWGGVLTAIALALSEAWKAWVNQAKLSNASQNAGASASGIRPMVDLY